MNSSDSAESKKSWAHHIMVQLQAYSTREPLLANHKYLTTIGCPFSGSVTSSGSLVLPILDGKSCLEVYPPWGTDTTVTLTITPFR